MKRKRTIIFVKKCILLRKTYGNKKNVKFRYYNIEKIIWLLRSLPELLVRLGNFSIGDHKRNSPNMKENEWKEQKRKENDQNKENRHHGEIRTQDHGLLGTSYKPPCIQFGEKGKGKSTGEIRTQHHVWSDEWQAHS